MFSLQPAGDQPSTCCSHRAGDGILLRAGNFIPGGLPLQEESCAGEPSGPSPLFSTQQRSRTSSGTDPTANPLIQSLGSAAEAPSIISEAVASMRCFSSCEPVAALPLEAFLGAGNAEHSPTYPRNSNCIFLSSPSRVFWEGWDPQHPVQRAKPVPAPTWKLEAIAQQPSAPTPFQKHRSAVLSLSPCRKPGDDPAHMYDRAV